MDDAELEEHLRVLVPLDPPAEAESLIAPVPCAAPLRLCDELATYLPPKR